MMLLREESNSLHRSNQEYLGALFIQVILQRAVQKALHLFCFNIEKILIKYLKYSRHLDYILNHFCYTSDAFLEQIIKVRST